MTLKPREVFEIHRLLDAGESKEAIGRELGISVPTIMRYLRAPEAALTKGTRQRPSLLDPFREKIDRMLEECPSASAVVIYQRLAAEGYAGKVTILKDHLRQKRGRPRRTYLRFESLPGDCFQVDWGHFGHLAYGRHVRPLYCFAMIECFSRMLYLQFTHSVKLDVFLDCHLQAFRFFGGCCREIVVDNMKTAVVERDGRLVRFNEKYLDFLRRVHAVPYACTPGAPHEKGKVENIVGFIRHNFFPLRRFKDLHDVNEQAARWRDEVANVRVHETTGERPADRFKRVSLRTIAGLEGYDSREVFLTTGPQDLVHFDANRYSIPFWAAGKDLVVKASADTVTIYSGKDIVARHERCWSKYQSVVKPQHRDGMTSQTQKAYVSGLQEVLVGMGPVAAQYLQSLHLSTLPIRRTLQHLVDLKDRFGNQALLRAMRIALEKNLAGTDYIEQILLQLSSPHREIPRLELKDHPELSNLRLSQIDLAVYDSVLLTKGSHHDDEEPRHREGGDQGDAGAALPRPDGRKAR
jgi:transposase